jgi:phosphohistidine phosphatase SixA/CHAD domain-containing protein
MRGGGVPDEERPLTKEGRADAARLGDLLRAGDRVPDFIVSSPARRAQQTASSVARSAGFSQPLRTDAALYGGGDAGIGTVVRAIPPSVRRVLIVGHDPGISRFLARLTGARASLPAGGLAEIDLRLDDWSRVDESLAQGRLVRLWRPLDTSADVSLRPLLRDAHPRPSKWLDAGADEPVLTVAQRAVEQKLDEVLERLATVAEAAGVEDVDAIRKLRVATRRAEAALRAFRDLLPRRAADRVREQLRSVRKATNAARDDDVLLLRLESAAPADFLAALRVERRAAQLEVQALCRRLAGDAGLVRSVASLRRKTQRHGHDATAMGDRFGAWARARLARSTERFFAAEPFELADCERLHDLRLRAKKLRYEIELLAAVLPSRLQAEIHPALTELQDRLGAVNDHASAVRRLRRAADEAPPDAVSSFDLPLREADVMLARSHAELAMWWTPERARQLQRMFAELG